MARPSQTPALKLRIKELEARVSAQAEWQDHMLVEHKAELKLFRDELAQTQVRFNEAIEEKNQQIERISASNREYEAENERLTNEIERTQETLTATAFVVGRLSERAPLQQ